MQWERRWSCVIAVAVAGCGGGEPGAGESDSDGGLADELELPGFVIDGAAAGDRALAVPCGDINGDGLEDLAVGTSRAGQLVAYVVYGKEDDEPVELAEIEAGGSGGLVLYASAFDPPNYYEASLDVVGVGDVNDDGFDDLAVAPRYEFVGGASLVLGGPELPVFVDITEPPGDVEILAIDIDGDIAAGDGVEAARIGDINGDGFDDVALTAVGGFADRFYVLLGDSAIMSRMEDELRAGDGGFEIDRFGTAQVLGPADINGDGVDDLVVAELGSYSAAAVDIYVLFGGGALGADSPLMLDNEPPLSVPGFMVRRRSRCRRGHRR